MLALSSIRMKGMVLSTNFMLQQNRYETRIIITMAISQVINTEKNKGHITRQASLRRPLERTNQYSTRKTIITFTRLTALKRMN